jgi:hypothetical protein
MDGLPDLPTVLLPFWSARQWVGGCFRRIANYIRQYTGVYHHSHREKPSGRLYSIREYYDGTNADRRGRNVKCWNIRIDENSLARNRVDCYFCPCRKSSEAALRRRAGISWVIWRLSRDAVQGVRRSHSELWRRRATPQRARYGQQNCPTYSCAVPKIAIRVHSCERA